ncbi:MAG: sulfite exporter TauE/SafE family protein [Victivallales bacterium]|nr:sulfite exporter TauE/SafE family protein [Victivallales bacterium]
MSWLLIGSALWLGVLTAISPCPLATNIAAISFIGRQVGHDRAVLLSGLLYTIGRVLVYVLLGVGIIGGMMAGGELSRFLQLYMNEILGPLLILLGMVLLGMLGGSLSINFINSEKLHKKAEKNGILMALPVGVVFALSFCPVSAGLFFCGLIPLAINNSGGVFLVLIYGIGTALPVVFFSSLIAFGGEYLGKAFHCLTKVELWVRRGAGTLLIIAGIYYCLRYIYLLNI